MAVKVRKVNEYDVECDECGYEEVLYSYDQDNGVIVHSIETAMRAARFHKRKGKCLCPICYANSLCKRS